MQTTPIKTEEDYKAALKRLEAVFDAQPGTHNGDELEALIASIELVIGQQTKFVMPGGTRTAAMLHLARAITRRAERNLVKLSHESSVNPELLKYANRLSSALIVLSMLENRKKGIQEKNPEYR